MKTNIRSNKKLISTLLSLALFLSCNSVKNSSDKKKDPIISTTTQTAIYVASNKIQQNSIYAYTQNEDGTLNFINEYVSGGKGSGNIEIFDWGYDPTHPLKDGIDPLISAYALTKTQNNKHLLVCNPGDGSISAFTIHKDKSLTLTDTQKAGHLHPNSIASHNNLVYVASSSGSDTPPPFKGNLKGFKVSKDGKLTAIPNSIRALNARPSCAAFSNDGKFLIVNELVSGLVKVYGVHSDGQLSKEPLSKAQCPNNSEPGRWLPIPVGFDIVEKGNNSIVLVSEARFLTPNGTLREEANIVPQSPKYSWQTGSTSSFSIDPEGMIKLISGDIKTGNASEGGQIANCWVEISSDGNTLYTANALSSSISTYAIKPNGEIILNDATAYKDSTETIFFSDLAISKKGRFLNQLIGNKGQILVIDITNNKLKKVTQSGNMVPIGTFGLTVVE
ncbi:lactonase family protein [Tenacibaculum maritimum]|uniref:Probable lipoprotein n=2 Tax=Tenacibaculum maritimum TaxID=107401 RepID=A0A2H1E6K0_9FLAO|nr:beta-propeller fold lactonase family protein [Tenacibaculum maritimum]SFZ80400.1 Probable lipoprotein precursor [Tenacibaculum maritimum NCIMB 2154]